MKSLKKSAILLFILLSAYVHAQIILPENKSIIKSQEMKREFAEIMGYAKYNSTIIGYAINCSLAKEDNKVIFENYFKSVETYNLNKEENIQIKIGFDETLKIAKDKGPANSSMTCDSFKVEFDKIVSHIKNNK